MAGRGRLGGWPGVVPLHLGSPRGAPGPHGRRFPEQELDAPLTAEEPASGLWSAGLTDTGPLSLSVALLTGMEEKEPARRPTGACAESDGSEQFASGLRWIPPPTHTHFAPGVHSKKKKKEGSVGHRHLSVSCPHSAFGTSWRDTRVSGNRGF